MSERGGRELQSVGSIRCTRTELSFGRVISANRPGIDHR